MSKNPKATSDARAHGVPAVIATIAIVAKDACKDDKARAYVAGLAQEASQAVAELIAAADAVVNGDKPAKDRLEAALARAQGTPQTIDLYRLSFDELAFIALDRSHPQREEAGEILDQWQADDASRRTPAGARA